MKSYLILAVTLSLALLPLSGCEVRKTGDETYEVKVPEKEIEAAGEKAKESAAEAGQEIREAAKEAAPVIREGIRDAAQATGEAMQRVGDEIEQRTGTATSTPVPSPIPTPTPR